MSGIQLVTLLELLVTCTRLWVTSFQVDILSETGQAIGTTVQGLAGELLHFLQVSAETTCKCACNMEYFKRLGRKILSEDTQKERKGVGVK